MIRSLVPGKNSWLLETLTRAPDASLIVLIVAPAFPMTLRVKVV
jgi:hypothetical protein